MGKIFALVGAVVVAPIFLLVLLVGAISGPATEGAAAVGYGSGLEYCLSPKPKPPWDQAQMQASAVIVGVEADASGESSRAEQLGIAASIWQSNLVDLSATASTLPAGIFDEGPSWGTLTQREDALDEAAMFAAHLNDLSSWQTAPVWPTIRAVLGLPPPPPLPAGPGAAPPSPHPPLGPGKEPGGKAARRKWLTKERAYKAALRRYETSKKTWAKEDAAWQAKASVYQAALHAQQARRAKEAADWSEARQLVKDVTAFWTASGCGGGVAPGPHGGQANTAPGSFGLPANYAIPAGVSSQVQAVLAFALAQLGKPYVWGAAGPAAFDCSGLTMAAWAQAGVSLVHYTVSQMHEGVQVPASQVAPGDLVLTPGVDSPGPGLPGHVGIYLGDGLVESALDPQWGVIVQSWSVFVSGGLDAVVDPA